MARAAPGLRIQGGEPESRMSWKFLAAVLLAATPVYAQNVTLAPVLDADSQSDNDAGAQKEPGRTAVSSTMDADLLRDLPTSDSLFQVLETTQPSLISDRFSGGGLFTGQAARVGSFFGSSTQTFFRLGDVSITDPTGSGAPLAFPDLALWQRIRITTGMMPASTNAIGLAISLDPLEPTKQWIRTVTGLLSHGFLASNAPSTAAPAIARLGAWDRASATATGPLIDGRLGGAFAVSWNQSSEFRRSDAEPVEADQESAFAHLVFTPSARHEFRTIGWLQRTSFPSPLRTPLGLPDAGAEDLSGHAQFLWERHPENALQLRLSGGYTQRTRTSETTNSARIVFERLTDGPLSQLAFAGPSTVRQWSVGATIRPPASDITRTHTVEAGVEFSGARASQSLPLSGPVGELVDGIPARVWMVAHPDTDSLHSETQITGGVSDHVRLGSRLTLDAGLAIDIVSGSAVGAANGIAWQTLLPRASLRWSVRDSGGMAVFAGYGRSAYRLPLDLLAIGDPAALRADLFRWDAPAGAEPPLTALGPLVARVGPGTGGDNTFSAIDTDLKRPYTDELVVGLEARPRHDLILRVLGMARRERNGMGLVNTGVPVSAYSVIGVPDMSINVQDPADDGIVNVYNRLPASFGRDRYLLTNPTQDDSTSESFELSVQLTKKHALFFIGGTASQTDGPAANRGYGPLENDEGIVGEVFTNPNAEGYARGRLFNDRAFTGKIVSVFHLPRDFRLGLLVRYQDGQPFSRLIVMPGLNQGAEAVRAFANGGSRFTYTGTLDVRLQKTFPAGRFRTSVILDAYNLPNMRNEVEEDVVTGAGFRTVTAVQPSRAIHLGLRLVF